MDREQGYFANDSDGYLPRLKRIACDYITTFRSQEMTLDGLSWALENVVAELEDRGVPSADELRSIWTGVETLNALSIDSGVPADEEELDEILSDFTGWIDRLYDSGDSDGHNS